MLLNTQAWYFIPIMWCTATTDSIFKIYHDLKLKPTIDCNGDAKKQHLPVYTEVATSCIPQLQNCLHFVPPNN